MRVAISVSQLGPGLRRGTREYMVYRKPRDRSACGSMDAAPSAGAGKSDMTARG